MRPRCATPGTCAQTGADPGPAGTLLAAWRRLASRSPGVDPDTLRAITALLGIRWSEELAPLAGRVAALARSGLPAPLRRRGAAARGPHAAARTPSCWAGGWPTSSWRCSCAGRCRCRCWSLPPAAAPCGPPGAAAGFGRRTTGFERAVCLALAEGAAAACRLAADLAPRAARLAAVAPTLRAKGAGGGDPPPAR